MRKLILLLIFLSCAYNGISQTEFYNSNGQLIGYAIQVDDFIDYYNSNGQEIGYMTCIGCSENYQNELAEEQHLLNQNQSSEVENEAYEQFYENEADIEAEYGKHKGDTMRVFDPNTSQYKMYVQQLITNQGNVISYHEIKEIQIGCCIFNYKTNKYENVPCK